MSHQTGIHANQDLLKFFGSCKEGSVRGFKVDIKNEELVLDGHTTPKGSWEDDYDKCVLSFIERAKPCYIFYRLDTRNEAGYEWLFISWSPDDAPVRQKMLFASTKATLKKEFGGSQIKHEHFGVQKEEVSLKAYKKSKDGSVTPPPLSDSEALLEGIKKSEAVTGSGQTVQGIPLPITDDAIRALYDIKENRNNFVQFSIDMQNEQIVLVLKEQAEIKSLSSKIPVDHPRYHLLNFPHSYEGDFLETTVFIYTVPDYDCPVKERMLYSSCKAPLLDTIENKIGIEIGKKIEISSDEKLTEELLMDELHPKTNIFTQKFAKPKGPSNRGAKRLLKSPRE